MAKEQEPETRNPNRHSQWLPQAAFSTLCLVSIINSMVGDLKDQTKELKWSVSAFSISLGFAGIAIFANYLLLNGKFQGTRMEGGMALTNIAIWLGALPTVMNPRNDLATTGGGFITNANLYTFAWAGFFAAVAVLASYMKVAGYSKDNSGARNKSFSPVGWAALAACSCIAMAAAIHLYRDRKCDESNPVFDDVFVLENHSAYCNRTEFAFSLGVISGCIAAVWAFLGSRFPVIFDSLLSFVMLAAWVCGLAYITFGGNKAPGNIVGNMLFFTLGAISIAIYIAISGFQNMLDEMGFGGSTTDATPEPTPEEPTQGEGEAAEGEDPTQGDGEAAEEEAVEV